MTLNFAVFVEESVQVVRKALRVRFLRNGDKYFKGIVLPISTKYYKSIDKLMLDLTKTLSKHVLVKSAVNRLYRINGTEISSLSDLAEEDIIVCCCLYEHFVDLEYNITQESVDRLMGRVIAVTYSVIRNKLSEEEMVMPDEALKLLQKFFYGPKPVPRSNVGTGSRNKGIKINFLLKVVDKYDITDHISYYNNEIEILRNEGHRNVIGLIYVEEQHRHRFILLENLDCSVHELLKMYPEIDENTVAGIMTHVSHGIQHLHSSHIIHRALSPRNLVVKLAGRDSDQPVVNIVKIADFSSAVYYYNYRYERCGELPYMPPQMVACTKYDEKVDIWSLGITFYYLLYKELPLHSTPCCYSDCRYLCIQACYDQLPQEHSVKISAGAQSLLDALVVRDPNGRLSAAELCTHPFLQLK